MRGKRVGGGSALRVSDDNDERQSYLLKCHNPEILQSLLYRVMGNSALGSRVNALSIWLVLR